MFIKGNTAQVFGLLFENILQCRGLCVLLMEIVEMCDLQKKIRPDKHDTPYNALLDLFCMIRANTDGIATGFKCVLQMCLMYKILVACFEFMCYNENELSCGPMARE